MTLDRQISELKNIESLAEMLEQKASSLKKISHKARLQLEGVSTSSNARKGKDYSQSVHHAVAQRNMKVYGKA